MTVFMVLSSWRDHCKSSPGSFDADWEPSNLQCFDVVGWAAGRASGL